MPEEESTSPGVDGLTSFFRTLIPDGTDMAHVTRDDTAWAAYAQRLAFLPADFVYEDSALPDHAGERYRGTDGLRAAFRSFVETFDQVIYELERVVGSEDHVVAIYRLRAVASHTQIRLDFRFAYLSTLRGGRTVHMRGFRDPDRALEAAGLHG